jgi:uncharacterized protein (TIGR02391 family)
LEEKKALLTPRQMQDAVPKLKSLIAELKDIDVQTIQERGELRFEKMAAAINDTLASIFGKDTEEYQRFRIETLDQGRVHMMYEIPLYEVKEGYKKGIEQAIARLRAVIELFGEKILTESENVHERALRALTHQSFHPAIESAMATPFQAGRYAEAVQTASQELERMVMAKANRQHGYGSELMHLVFSPDNPVLQLNTLHTDTEKKEQQGLHLLFAGAMSFIETPSALKRFDEQAEEALQFIGFISFLADIVARCLPVD